MNLKTPLFYTFLFVCIPLITSDRRTIKKQCANPIKQQSSMQVNFTLEDFKRRADQLVSAHIQALRNAAIIENPELFAHKKYNILEWLVCEHAQSLDMPYATLEQNPAYYYAQYSDNYDELPNKIKVHPLYARYNNKDSDF